MKSDLNIERLATMVRAKRGNRNLRDTATEIGNLSPSTLSRVENAKTPDMETFLLLCDWLEVAPAELFSQEGETPKKSSGDQITLQLRADKNLDPATANVLAALVTAAYDQFGRKEKNEKD
ncbi:MAG: helix-turn-helix transcriptional regulator [Fibrella sp.]|nr:helix-turn-helix transcriptional regulator [Armatimonadota bacterium]